MERPVKRLVLFILVGVAYAARPATALCQGVDVIRGRATDADGRPVAGVSVAATSANGGVNRTARSNDDGRYTITFGGGEGHYLLVFSAVGFVTRRLELRRVADEDILIADVRLQRLSTLLDTALVTGRRQRVAQFERRPDIGGNEQLADRSAIAPEQQADIYRLAGTVPGSTTVFGVDGDPAGFSVLGLPGDQNRATLNGMWFSGAAVPRDASLYASLVTSPYDVSRGGFSGAQLNLQPTPGSNFVRRSASLLLDAEPLQLTDRIARALGQRYSSASLSGVASGPIKLDRAFYNVSYQVDRRSNALRTLANTGALGLQAAGIAADSANRLVRILSEQGIPLTPTTGSRSNRTSDDASVFGTLDLVAPGSGSSQTLNLTFNGSGRRQAPVGQSAGEMPAYSGVRDSWNVGAQVNHGAYVKSVVLTETTLETTISRQHGDPYLAVPGGSVLVRSDFVDGSESVRRLSFGGNSALGFRITQSVLGLRNQISWMSANNAHRIKMSSEVRRLTYGDDQSGNSLGSFTYASLADVEANRPSGFTRSLRRTQHDISEYVGSLSIGDSYRVSQGLQLQYGVRLDGSRFATRPSYNSAVLDAFGVRNDAVPNRVHVSPRVGFSWAYGSAPQFAAFDGAARVPRAVIRGGVGVFQGGLLPSALRIAFDETGLTDGAQQVRCVGDAIPRPAWTTYASDVSSIPHRCADGTTGTPFSSTAPRVSSFARNFVAPRSVRGNLQWSGPVLGNRFATTIEGVYSRNLSQPSVVDLNVAPVVGFVLSGEGGRPVFANVGSIVPANGAIAPGNARIVSSFDQVLEQRSDLSSVSRQIRVGISPVRASGALTWSATYVYSNSREQYRGFTSTAGDPHERGWTAGSFESRHQLTADASYSVLDAVRIAGYFRLSSGSPFTPLVVGDINGDGLSNDRAFVPDPDATRDPTLAAGMRRLLDAGPSAARTCLGRQLGIVAGRNSCRGPWTSSANMVLSFDPAKMRLSERLRVSLIVSNPLSALDIALHGRQGARGWGNFAAPDQTLLVVRGFDASAARFRYEVNPRFGRADPQVNVFRQPTSFTLSARIEVGPSRERQTITRQLDRGRSSPGERMSEEILRSLYGSGGIPNPIAHLIRQSDTLALNGAQVDSLVALNVAYTTALDSIWSGVTRELAALPMKYHRGSAYRLYRRARESSIDRLVAVAPYATGVLDERQKRSIPPLVANHLDPKYLKAVRSGKLGDSGAGVFSNASPGFSREGTTITRVNVIINGRP